MAAWRAGHAATRSGRYWPCRCRSRDGCPWPAVASAACCVRNRTPTSGPPGYGRAAAALRPRDHEPGHQPVPGATHATELRQTLLFPPRPVTPASQCADRIACMRPRPGRIDPRQIAISPALVRDHSGRPRAYGVTGTLRLNGGTDGHQASRPMASEDFLDEGLFMSIDGLGMNGNGRKGSKEGASRPVPR